MTSPLRILLTNNTLALRAGSELFLSDVAQGLLRRGHLPVAYSTTLGELGEELQQKTIPVIDDLNALQEPPDVIHAQHHLEAMSAMLHFPETPVVYYCHGWLPWQERPVVFPNIATYVAVDDLCRERLLTTPGIASEQVRTLYNFVDLKRYQPRAPLPEQPQSALIFSNQASDQNYAGLIRAACRARGIERVDLIGQSSGNVQSRPEELLPQYDVVFAKARCALEAMAVGCAVVVTEHYGVGGLVTSQNMQQLRRLNFGVRTMQAAPLTEASLVDALSGYNAADASKVSEWIRQEADLEQYLNQLELLYQGAIQWSQGKTVSPDSKFRAAANYLQELASLVKRQAEVEQRAAGFEQRAQLLEQQLQHLQLLQSQLQSQLQEQQMEQEQTAQEYAEFRGSIAGRLALKLQRMRLWLTGPR
ncbi:hypothetical protein V6x_51110 [Gimesia chilikensis]|uniref:Glycosyltransferase subfamily 4-like N-terminal domain-containing protein n=1 Tax=Gimesia chilikensis TaxID=2605989 RepID=A0A517WJF6_9PLAN|nr:glycosyltransferase [Gimesia chilikensis]QDU05375.1 hypothetical protein V6x_51110 [Gimesia chilikensis]